MPASKRTYTTRSASNLSETSAPSVSSNSNRFRIQRSASTLENADGIELDDHTLNIFWLSGRKQKLFHAFLQDFINQNVWIATANGWPAEAKTVSEAVASLANDLRRTATREMAPSVVMVLVSEALDPKEVLAALREQFPDTPNIHGATSCLGVTTEAGFRSSLSATGECPLAIGLWAIFDPLGSYVTVGLPPAPPKENTLAVAENDQQNPSTSALTENVFFVRLDAAYRELRKKAQKVVKTERSLGDEVIGPEALSEHLAIWMTSLVGMEELALEALYQWGQSRFGRSIPVVGGTAADSTIGGNWFCFCQTGGHDLVFGKDEPEGMVVTLMACCVKVHPLFMHPFTPMSEFRAKVVSCGSTEHDEQSQGRVILRLRDTDGVEHAAGDLYHSWCESQIQENLMPSPIQAESKNSFSAAVLKASTLCPLGVPVANEGDDAFDYRMLHPSGIYNFTSTDGEVMEDAYLKAFAGVTAEHSEVVLFKARRGDLLHRISKMKEQLVVYLDRSNAGSGGNATTSVGGSPDAMRSRIAGGLMTYCAGCLMGLREGNDGGEQTRRLGIELQKVLSGRPFMTMHPFGEQGFYQSKQKSMQANLMWSALVITRDPCFEVDETMRFDEIMQDILSHVAASNRKANYVSKVLCQLLMRGSDVDWKSIGELVDSNSISVDFLQELALCAAQPFRFSLHAAGLFHRLATMRPLKARTYDKAADWHKAFCSEFVAAASLRQVFLGGILGDEVLGLAVTVSLEINAKHIVATQIFQDIIQEMWVSGSQAQTSLERMLNDVEHPGISEWGPNMRYNANTLSYATLILVHAFTSLFMSDTPWLWLIIAMWGTGYLAMTLAAPASGFFTWASMLRNIILVASLLCIFIWTLLGRSVPNDLNSIAMLIHFVNIAQQFVVHPTYGPLIIMVQRMSVDIAFWLSALGFCVIAFYFTLRALYAGQTPEFVGETYGGGAWPGAVSLLVNYVGGSQLLWTVPEPVVPTVRRTILSQVLGTSDAFACDIVGFSVMIFAWLLCPVLLVNLLIAMMTTSFSRVQKDSDLEWKWFRASAVLVAREMSTLPVPLNLFQDGVRLVRRVFRIERDVSLNVQNSDTMFKENHIRWSRVANDTDRSVAQNAVEQIVLQWETQKALETLKSRVNMDQMERMRTQVEAVTERVNMVHIATQMGSAKLDCLRQRGGEQPHNLGASSGSMLEVVV